MSNVVRLVTKATPGRMVCKACRASTTAPCNCNEGWDYVPPSEIAAQVVAENPQMSPREIAETTGVSESTARRAKCASPSNGGKAQTKLEIAIKAVAEHPTLGDSELSRMYGIDRKTLYKARDPEIRAPRRSQEGSTSRRQMSLPKDVSVIQAVKKGMMVEDDDGKTAEEAAKVIGIHSRSYRQVRDVILLDCREDLSKADRAVVKEAIDIIERDRQSIKAHAMVKPLIDRIYGIRGHRATSDKKRIELFKTAIAVIEGACDRAAELEVPYLAADEAKSAVKVLKACIGNLINLHGRLNQKEAKQ